MENYRKAGVVEQPCTCPFLGLAANTPEVRVRDGSKIRNLLKFALSRMEGKAAAAESSGAQEEAEPNTSPEQNLSRQIVFTGVGPSVAKAITCVEILKRRIRGLHQFTRLLYRTVQETWEPLEPASGLDSLTVSRNMPGIWVLLSREPLDCSQPGYQAPGSFDALWAQSAKEEASAPQRRGQRRKQGAGGGSARGKGPRKQAGRAREGHKAAGQE